MIAKPVTFDMKTNRRAPSGTSSVHSSLEVDHMVALFNAGRHSEVEKLAVAMLDRSPDFGFAWKALGAAQKAQGKDALLALQKATRLLPGDADAHCNLGAALHDRHQFDAAVAHHVRALELTPDSALAHCNLGNSLWNLGRLDEAMACFRRAVEIKSDYAEAHASLGSALLERGQFENAVACIRRALEINPGFVAAYNNLGNALLHLAQHDGAAESYRRALEIFPNFAETHNNLASALRKSGHFDDAVASYRQAIAIMPSVADMHKNLGNTYKDLGQFDNAAASYRHALAIRPDIAEVHNNLGLVLQSPQEFEEVVACFHSAACMQPDFAEAYYNLAVALRHINRNKAEANCNRALEINPNLVVAMILAADFMIDQGQFPQAEELLRRVIAIEADSADSAEAWARLAGLRKLTSADADWLAEAQRLIAKNLPPSREASLRFALGKYFDDVKDFDEAFLNYRRANALLKQHEPKYDRQGHAQRIEQTRHIYDKAWLNGNRRNADIDTSKRPVFIVGMPRSGTSLAEQILASHPSVFGAGEIAFWNAASEMLDANMFDASVRDKNLDLTALEDLQRDYLQLLARYSTDALRVIDKMPANFMSLGLIHAALPNAKIIHMQRNPIDTCLSIYFQFFNSKHPYSYDLEDLAHYFMAYRRIMEHWQTTLPGDAILHVPYEGMIEDQEGWSRKMLDFIGLPWDERCLDFHQNMRTVATASNWQVRQKINTASVERWRNYEKYVGPLLGLMH
jgi:tetratricopeptide (TPR) repeat protein